LNPEVEKAENRDIFCLISMIEQLSGVVQVPCRCPGNCQDWCRNWPNDSFLNVPQGASLGEFLLITSVMCSAIKKSLEILVVLKSNNAWDYII